MEDHLQNTEARESTLLRRSSVTSRLVLLSILYSCVSGLSSGIGVVALPFIFHKAGVRISQYGFIEASSLLLSSIILVSISGFPSRVLAIISSLTLPAAWAAMASFNVYIVLPAYMAVYVSRSILALVIASSILERVEKLKATALGLVSSASFASSVMGPLIAAYVMDTMGIRAVIAVTAGLSSIIVAIAPAVGGYAPHREEAGLRELLKTHRPAALFVVIAALGALPGSLYMVFEDIVGVYIGGFGPKVIGAYEAFEALLITILGPVGGYIVDRSRRRYLLPAIVDSLSIPYAALVLIGAWAREPLIYLLAPIPDALMSSLTRASQVLIRDLGGPTKRLLALQTSISDLIASASTVTGGLLLDLVGPMATLGVVVVLTTIVIVIDLTVLVSLYKRAVTAKALKTPSSLCRDSSC